MEHLLSDLIEWIVAFDAAAFDVLVDLRSPLLTKLMNSVTGLGSVAAGLVFLGLVYLAEWREEFRLMFVAMALSGVLVITLMFTVQRPYPPNPVCLTDGSGTVVHSFPSGHAAAAAVYAMVAHRSETIPFRITAILAATLAFSRFYLGTHYLSDTLVGVFIGIGTVLVAERLIDSGRLSVLFERV